MEFVRRLDFSGVVVFVEKLQKFVTAVSQCLKWSSVTGQKLVASTNRWCEENVGMYWIFSNSWVVLDQSMVVRE